MIDGHGRRNGKYLGAIFDIRVYSLCILHVEVQEKVFIIPLHNLLDTFNGDH